MRYAAAALVPLFVVLATTAASAETVVLDRGIHGPAPFDGAGRPPSVRLPKSAPAAATAPSTVDAGPRSAPSAKPPKPRTSTVPAVRSSKVVYSAGMSISGTAKVLDGQSMAIDGKSVRLDGIEAPGLSQTCRTALGTDWPCGQKSFMRLADLADGKKVSCSVTEQAGEGAAATCSVRGIADLGQFLAGEGLAVPNGHDRGRYSTAASAARASKSGVWGGTFEAPWVWRRKNP